MNLLWSAITTLQIETKQSMYVTDNLHMNYYISLYNLLCPKQGGFGTYQEMCLAFIIYYPRNNRVLHACANVNTGSELKRIIGENK